MRKLIPGLLVAAGLAALPARAQAGGGFSLHVGIGTPYFGGYYASVPYAYPAPVVAPYVAYRAVPVVPYAYYPAYPRVYASYHGGYHHRPYRYYRRGWRGR